VSTPETEALTFEEALAKLEGIVARLERGDCTLEESLALFEEGARLRGLCLSLLAEAERKIQVLAPEGDDGADEEA